MRATLWGTRGSLASAGPETARYGGNTACVEVRGEDGCVVILDAGSGIRRLGDHLVRLETLRRVDIFLTHLHMDHIQGLGFFAPFFRPDVDTHIWGPPSATGSLRSRLGRYLSPPLFPVRVRDLRRTTFHEAPVRAHRVGTLTIVSDLVIHPGPTVGYRIEEAGRILTYLPDHEPALGVRRFPSSRRWTSGAKLAAGADVLIHDTQYTEDELRTRVGYGHSTVAQAVAFAELVGARTLVPFHHDPAHDDVELDAQFAGSMLPGASVLVDPGREGMRLTV